MRVHGRKGNAAWNWKAVAGREVQRFPNAARDIAAVAGALEYQTAGDEPWKEIDRGTLRKWERGDLTEYRLIAGGVALEWTRERGSDGLPRDSGDLDLSHFVTRRVDVPSKYRFEPDPMPGTRLGYDIEPRSVSANENGEITERFGPFTIASVLSPECPKK